MIDYFTSQLLDEPLKTEFNRIVSGEEISSGGIPYTIEYIDIMIKYFEIREDYEKCKLLIDFKNNKLNSHELRYV